VSLTIKCGTKLAPFTVPRSAASKVTTFVVDAVYNRNMVGCIWTVCHPDTITRSPGTGRVITGGPDSARRSAVKQYTWFLEIPMYIAAELQRDPS
jgi:hypothetical protein